MNTADQLRAQSRLRSGNDASHGEARRRNRGGTPLPRGASRCLAALTSLLITTPVLAGESYVPARDEVVLERVAPRTGALRDAQARLAADPAQLELAVALATEYVALGSRASDPRYYGRAQALLAPWWDDAAPPLAVLRLRAQVRQSHHDFDGALADLDALLAQAPRDADAWFMRAVIFEVRGDPERATASCAPLWQLADPLTATACLASAASLGGRAEQSYGLLAGALERAPDAPADTRAWALTTLAEIAARLGRDAVAEAHFRAALAVREPDQYLLASYADFLLDAGRLDDVRALLAERLQMDPLLLRAAIAARRAGAADAERLADALRERFDALRARADTAHLGNEARYVLELRDDPARALELALANFTAQREPVDVRLVLECALAAERPERAREVLAWLGATGLEDRRIEALARKLEDRGA
jgi:hypothetical protein